MEKYVTSFRVCVLYHREATVSVKCAWLLHLSVFRIKKVGPRNLIFFAKLLQRLWCQSQLVQFSSVAQSCLTLGDSMNCSTPGLAVNHQLPESTQTHVHWVSDAIQPSHPLSSLLLLPSVFPSIRVFSNGSALCIRWPKYWSFSFSITPSNKHPGLISFRMDWSDLLAVQGNLKSLLQHHSPKASIFWRSAFFRVQLSHHT